jgi:hypothetical protein
LGCTGDINPPAPADAPDPKKLLPTDFASELKELVTTDSVPILGCTDDVEAPMLDPNKLLPAVIAPEPKGLVLVLVSAGFIPGPKELLVGEATSNKLLPFGSATPEPNELIPAGFTVEPNELLLGDITPLNEKLFPDEIGAPPKVILLRLESFEVFSLDADSVSGAIASPPNALGALPGIGG